VGAGVCVCVCAFVGVAELPPEFGIVGKPSECGNIGNDPASDWLSASASSESSNRNCLTSRPPGHLGIHLSFTVYRLQPIAELLSGVSGSPGGRQQYPLGFEISSTYLFACPEMLNRIDSANPDRVLYSSLAVG
jgi:hypothetical protein